LENLGNNTAGAQENALQIHFQRFGVWREFQSIVPTDQTRLNELVKTLIKGIGAIFFTCLHGLFIWIDD
jgi:hypothetical protein